MDYTPVQPQAASQPKPEYLLVEDVTHEPAPKRGPFILKDVKGQSFKVPFLPNPKCKKCYGRGYVGNEYQTNKIFICKKCYPLMK